MGNNYVDKVIVNGGWYKGEIKDNVAHGKGEFHWEDGEWHKGEYRDGTPNGLGEHHWPDGGWFKGEYRDGTPNGLGEHHWSDGGWYVGGWKNGNYEGKGERHWPNGDWYKGEYKDDLRHGFGEDHCSDGTCYKGYWKDDDMDGEGEYHWPDGGWYKGSWKHNNLDGYGERHWPNGDWYKGYWKDNDMDGEGEYHWTDGGWYKGYWKHGNMDGYGERHWPDGSWYKGCWCMDNMEGEGELHNPDGEVLRGKFKNDEFCEDPVEVSCAPNTKPGHECDPRIISMLENYHCPEEACRLGRLFEFVDKKLARRYYNHAISLGYDSARHYLKKICPNDLDLTTSQRSQLFEQPDEERIITADFHSYKSYKDAIMRSEQLANSFERTYCYIQAFALDNIIADFILDGKALPPFSEDSYYDIETLMQIIGALDEGSLKLFVSGNNP